MTTILDKNDFAAALMQPKALLFLYVDWAIQARASRTHIDNVIASWTSDSTDVVAVFVVDVSGQSGELWDAVERWLIEQDCPANQLMMSGAGSAILSRFGHVIMHLIEPLQYETNTLKALFQRAFKEGCQYKSPDGPKGRSTEIQTR